jgi:hypothetical protein
MVVVARDEVPKTAKSPVVVEFTNTDEVAKSLDEVLFVVDAFTAAKSVVVLFTKLDEVAKRLDEVAFVVEANVAARVVAVALPFESTLKLTFSVHADPFQ